MLKTIKRAYRDWQAKRIADAVERAILKDRFETRRIWKVHRVGGGVYDTPPVFYREAMELIASSKKHAIHVDFDNSFIFVKDD